METQQIDNVPLPTGSFTGLAILSPGVDAELPGGTGANSGLGNAPIWANGQRDTSNALLLNGVDASNLFNGKSTSQVDSFRVVEQHRPGQQRGRRRDSQRVLGLSFHRQRHPHAGARDHCGSARQRLDVRRAARLRQRRAHRHEHQVGNQPDCMAESTRIAAPTGSMPRRSSSRRTTTFRQPTRIPSCIATSPGGDFGGPIIKNKLFGFVGYQHLHISDQETGDELLDVPPGLNSGRSIRTAAYGKPDRCRRKQLDHQYWLRTVVGFRPHVWRHIQRLQPKLKSCRLQSVHHAGAARRAGKLSGSERACPTPTPTSIRPTTHSCPERRDSSPTRPSPISTGTWAPKMFSRQSTTTSTIPRARPTPTPTCRDSPRTWIPARRSVRSTTFRPSAQRLSISETVGILREKAYATNDQPFSPTSSRHESGDSAITFPGFTINDAIGDQVRLVDRAALWPDGSFAVHRARRGIPGLEYRRVPEPHHAFRHGHLGQGTPCGQLRRQLVLHAVEPARSSHRHGQCSLA